MPGLTSSFVAIFVALLAFDLIVAMQKFSLKLRHWREMLFLLLPRISGTAVTLARGLFIGAVFGALSQLGLPIFLGGVFTIGIGYHMSVKIKGNISSYVGMLAGLTVFDQIIRIPQLSPTLFTDMGGAILTMVYGTFTALFVGWFCGVIVGIVTRLLLPRGYRTTLSSAYELPLPMQPLKDVLHTNENMSIINIDVGPESEIAYKILAETGLRESYQTSILSIFRKSNDLVAPKGTDTIYPGDTLVLIMPTEQTDAVVKLVKGSGVSEQV